jgi:hypothetical protein
MAAATAVIASTSGTKAASSAPNARIRITSVIGSEVNSAFWKSSSKALLSAFSALPSPNCSTRKPRCSLWSAATASSEGSTFASASSPGSSKVTSAERPSSESWPALSRPYGLATLRTFWVPSSRVTTSSTTARNSASPVSAPLRLWIRTLSGALSGKWSEIALSARPDSPMPKSASVSVFVPTDPPMNTASTTNASQPRIAFFRC